MKESNIRVEVAKKIIGRAGGVLNFIQINEQYGNDRAYIRSLLILLSYGVEMLLKAIWVLDCNLESEKEIETYVKGHDLCVLFSEISISTRTEFGIQNVTKNIDPRGFKYYTVTINNTEIVVQDFIEIRYDFTNQNLRDLDNDNVNVLKNNIKTLLTVDKKILDKLY